MHSRLCWNFVKIYCIWIFPKYIGPVFKVQVINIKFTWKYGHHVINSWTILEAPWSSLFGNLLTGGCKCNRGNPSDSMPRQVVLCKVFTPWDGAHPLSQVWTFKFNLRTNCVNQYWFQVQVRMMTQTQQFAIQSRCWQQELSTRSLKPQSPDELIE